MSLLHSSTLLRAQLEVAQQSISDLQSQNAVLQSQNAVLQTELAEAKRQTLQRSDRELPGNGGVSLGSAMVSGPNNPDGMLDSSLADVALLELAEKVERLRWMLKEAKEVESQVGVDCQCFSTVRQWMADIESRWAARKENNE